MRSAPSPAACGPSMAVICLSASPTVSLEPSTSTSTAAGSTAGAGVLTFTSRGATGGREVAAAFFSSCLHPAPSTIVTRHTAIAVITPPSR